MLVTGSRGFIGSIYVDAYGGAEYDLEKDHFDDVADLSRLRRMSSGHDCILHLAAESGIPVSLKMPSLTYRSNATGTFNVLEVSRLDKKRCLLASSAAADNTQSPYGVSKRVGELFAETYHKNFKVPYVAMRFSNVYGPFSRQKDSVVAKMCKDALKGEIEIYGTGKQTRDFIYVYDLIEAVHKLSTSEYSGLLNIASGFSHSIHDVADIIKAETDCRIIYRSAREGDVLESKVNISKTMDTIDWNPKMPFEDGIKKTLEWFR